MRTEGNIGIWDGKTSQLKREGEETILEFCKRINIMYIYIDNEIIISFC